MPDSIAATLKAVHHIKDVIPSIVRALRLLGTIPASVCECERCNSAIRRLKDYKRSTMSQERMDSLGVMSIHRYMNFDGATLREDIPDG